MQLNQIDILYLLIGVVIFSATAIIFYLTLKLQTSSLAVNYLKDQLNSANCENNRRELTLAEANVRHNQELELKFLLEKQLEIANLKLSEANAKAFEWEKTKDEAMNYAKAAMFDVSNQLTSKLIEEHKRESQEAKKSSQEKIEETTAKLHSQFEKVTNIIAALDGQVKESKDTVDLVKRALLSPIGAGALAEITLENILKGSGLLPDKDFIMQYSVTDFIDNSRLRPDALVFLPSGNVMIIDSKASKFFMDIASSNDEAPELSSKLKASMRNQLKELATKDYKEAIRSSLTKLRPGYEVKHISAIMFLPSEVALEKLQHVDQEFMHKAWEADIFPAGPVGIINILAHARFLISEDRQSQNHKIISEEVRKLLGSIATVYDYIKKVGSGIQSAANNYDKLAGSFNSSILPKARNLQKLGINMQKNKSLPSALERYQLISMSNHIIEAEPVEEDRQLELTEEEA